MIRYLPFLLALLGLATQGAAQRRGGEPKRGPNPKLERITIPGGPLEVPSGKLLLVADLFLKNPKDAPFLVYIHSGTGSRGEFRKAAIHLNERGYNGLAVDMRCGGRSDLVRNLTTPQLFRHGVQASVIDVLPDIVTTLRYVREHYAEGVPVVVLASASSATLCMRVRGDHPELMDGLMLFSPPVGYFEQFDKPKDWARRLAPKVDCPTFLTGLRSSRAELQALYDALSTERKMFFEPDGPGVHGGKALWPREPRSAEYWGAVTTFLGDYFPLPERGEESAEPQSDEEGG